MYIEVKLTLIKDGEELVGFSLVALPQAEAEFFCRAMPKALAEGEATITVEDTVATFVCPKEGQCSFDLKPEDAVVFKQLIEQEGPYKDQTWSFGKAGIFAPGFKLTLANKKHLVGLSSDAILARV